MVIMCCRYMLLREHLAMALKQLGLGGGLGWASRYNLSPGVKVPAALADGTGGRRTVLMHWGFPADAKTQGLHRPPLVNARAESLQHRPLFRESFRTRRCLIPASGFYEWKREGRARQPWLFEVDGGGPFFLAGLWIGGGSPDGDYTESCAVVTTEPNQIMRPIHHRMPAIIPMAEAAGWIDPDAGLAALAGLMAPLSAGRMRKRALCPRVNSVRHDDVACLDPADTIQAGGGAQQLLDI